MDKAEREFYELLERIELRNEEIGLLLLQQMEDSQRMRELQQKLGARRALRVITDNLPPNNLEEREDFVVVKLTDEFD